MPALFEMSSHLPTEPAQALSPAGRGTRRLRRAALCLALFGSAVLALWAGGGFAWVLHRWMASALAARDYETAEEALRWVERLHVRTSLTSYWEARLRRKQLRIEEVPALLEAAAQAGVAPELLRREAVLLRAQVGDLQAVRHDLNRLLTDPRGDGAEICEAYVNGCLIAGEYDLALTILANWQLEYASDPQPHYARGRLLEFLGQPGQAEEEFRQALSKQPEHWPARYSLGRLLLTGNQAEEALKVLETCASMRHNAAPEWRRAQALRALGQSDECRSILEALVRRPDEEVRASFLRVCEPEYGRPIELELGTLLASQGEQAAAVSWLDRVLAADPRNLDARYVRGMALRALGRGEEAVRELTEVERTRTLLKETDRLVDAVQQHPHELRVEECTRIGEVYLKHADRRKGEFWLRTALNRDPQHAPAHKLLAEHYAELARANPAYRPLAERHRRAADNSGRDDGRSE